MSRIFISYKRVDKEKVFMVKDQIESALGEKCWIDMDGIESDAQFKNVIIKAINECEVVLFMYSRNHSQIIDFEKDWTVRELNFAQKKGKRIVFVNLDCSPLTDVFEFDYGTKQQVDGTSEQAMLHLISDLANWLNINTITKYPRVGINDTGNIDGPLEQETSRMRSRAFNQLKFFNSKLLVGISVTFLLILSAIIMKNTIFTSCPKVKKIDINGSVIRMVYVNSGDFYLGNEAHTRKYDDDEYPLIPASVRSFYISDTEISRDIWNKVMDDSILYQERDKDMPIVNISYIDICSFLDRLNQNFLTSNNKYHFRLPTEIEWEYAAKGGQKSVGYTYSGSDSLEDVGWDELNSNKMPHAVAQKRPNEIGLYDMSGNVWELCSNTYFKYCDFNGKIENVACNDSTAVCVRRGGSFQDTRYCLRTSYRSRQRINERKSNVGFRLVLGE